MRKFIFILLAMFTVPAFAAIAQIITVQDKSVPIYGDANSNHKPITTLTKGQKIISVYQQGGWIKVANPENGDICWVKKDDWKAASKNVISIEQVGNGYSITSQSSDGSMNSTYRVIQTSGEGKENSEEM